MSLFIDWALPANSTTAPVSRSASHIDLRLAPFFKPGILSVTYSARTVGCPRTGQYAGTEVLMCAETRSLRSRTETTRSPFKKVKTRPLFRAAATRWSAIGAAIGGGELTVRTKATG